MAPADINLSQTRRWLAKLHTTDLPPPPSASSESSMHSSSGSADDGSSRALSPSTSGIGSNTSSHTTTSPLTEARARSLQRLCEISSGDARNAEAVSASGANERYAPGNINYIRTEPSRGCSAAPAGEDGQGASSVSPTKRGSSWARRKSSGQSLEELEGGSSLRRFSLSKFKLH
ncbi:hypothetical protein LMH87_011082 [Akanthomyces muscarius]|uniref:Uncharacterized protein n=1 Tax=Akanthomyces muscarius TaxID=2231603 RepID=A0A9W8QBR9_AKAMU|nr:hypothetical protein LMH87_011082 [Akanthomyces muscarius]KAJ4150328.1 hypothetical protein LMH87_011082 [Akanthomyces muscarius]